MTRWQIWLCLLVLALLFGLGINQTTIFWVGVLSIWVVNQGRK